MNVLIVDQDKNFSSAMNHFLSESKNLFSIDIYNDKENFNKLLLDDSSSYDISFLDVDLIGNDIASIHNKYPNCKIIGLTSNNKSLFKNINKPVFQRIFRKPVDVSDISSYLKIQNKIKFNRKTTIDSSKAALRKLSELGFNVSLNGTIYLSECISIAIQKKLLKLKEIYNEYSKISQIDSNLINWSINYAVDQANNDFKNEKLTNFFGTYDYRKVTAKLIIDYFVNNN